MRYSRPLLQRAGLSRIWNQAGQRRDDEAQLRLSYTDHALARR